MDQASWRARLVRLLAEGDFAALATALAEASSATFGRPVAERDLAGIALPGLRLSDFTATNLSLAEADLRGAELVDVALHFLQAQGIDLSGARIRGSIDGTFGRARFAGADMAAACLGGDFRGADFTDANLLDANLGLGTTFAEADFTGARLGSSDPVARPPAGLGLQGEAVSFYGAKLVRASLAGIDLKTATFDRADLAGANLERAWIAPGEEETSSSFFDASLREVRARCAILRGAQLQSADLTQADLSGASLLGAHLEGANLEKAVLDHANLEGATLDGARLKGACATSSTRWPQGFDPSAHGITIRTLPGGSS